MKILFLSHSFPPTWGGVERQNYYLAEELKKLAAVTVIANRKGKIWLPVFLPLAFLRALFLLRTQDACLLGNGVLAPLGAALKFFYPRKKIFCVVHGLDITFAHQAGFLAQIYKAVNIPALTRLDKLFMVGNHTITEAEKVGIARSHCAFIPNGINVADLAVPGSRGEMARILGLDLANKKIILRIARFVPHKGVEWFIRSVMPALPENYILAAVGGIVTNSAAGNENIFPKCEKAVRELGLEKRVKLIGDIDEGDKLILLNTADLYISPNIRVAGSMEGFGITAIEAAACGRVVLAADLEGLKDAIQNGRNGFLAEPENAAVWIQKIKSLLLDDTLRSEFGTQARQFTLEHYSWEKIAKRYLAAMTEVAK